MPVLFNGNEARSPIIAYDDARIQYLGRWNTASGKWTGWAGSQIVFKVVGTTKLRIFASVVDVDTTNLTFIASVVDNTSANSTVGVYTTQAQIYTGTLYVDVAIPDKGEHSVILHTSGLPTGMMAQTCKTTITGYMVDYGGIVLSWMQGTKVLQGVGDSWMGAQADWPRLCSRTRWKHYPIASGGLTCAQSDGYYNFQYGAVAASDITADAVIISFGVNDKNASVTQASFETSMYSLFDKVRVKQPSAPIILIRVPSYNTGTKDYGIYGSNMQTVVNNRTNAYYFDTSSLDATITWDADTYHLDATGKQTLATAFDAYMTSIGI